MEFVETVEQHSELQEIMAPKCAKVSILRGIEIALGKGNMR